LTRTAIIVAGGTGSRMRSETPKQFLPLAGKPMLMHSLQAFLEADPGILLVVALADGLEETWKELCRLHHFHATHRVVPGGPTRFHSVQSALGMLESEGFTAIHDAARPMVSPNLIRSLFATAETFGNCVPVVPVTESVRRVTVAGSEVADRSLLRLVQTPQVFRTADLKNAYRMPYDDAFTDDATVMERAGATIRLANGDPVNIKITRPADLAFAQAILSA